jgi:transposase
VASKNRFGCDEIIAGYESTGPYAEPLAQYLMGKPVTMVQVNPLHTKRMKEVNDNSPLKTDDKDPRVIADIIRLGRTLAVVVPEGDAAYLRRLNNARERHVGEQTALLNQLQQLVFVIFPEFKNVLKNMKGKTARYLLTRYTTPEKISTVPRETLGEEMRKRSRGKYGHTDAELLIDLARNTIGIKEGVPGIVLDIRHILMHLEDEARFIAEIEAEMVTTLHRIPASSRLLSIKGLGVVSVAGLIGEVGDFSKFRTRSEIMKLAGLDLYEISSGKIDPPPSRWTHRKAWYNNEARRCTCQEHGGSMTRSSRRKRSAFWYRAEGRLRISHGIWASTKTCSGSGASSISGTVSAPSREQAI